MKIFLTGATGFVGGHLARALGDEHEIHVLSRRATGRPNETVADLREVLDPRRLPATVDVVIHAASFIGPDGDPELFASTNSIGTIHAASAAVEMRAKRFVYLSTGGVYESSAAPLTETSPIAPLGHYAVSKWTGELAALTMQSRMRVQILRLFFPYGQGQGESRLVPRLADRIRKGEPVSAAGGEGPLLNPIYIDDLVESVRRLLMLDEDLVVNLAGPETVSIRGLAEEIGRIVGKPPVVMATPETPVSWVAEIAHAVRLTGYTPRVTVGEGLRRSIT